MLQLLLNSPLSVPSMIKKNQSGNVLFLILIAVALFAALSYAVTMSTRSGGGNASKESARSYAASLIQYTTAMKNAMTRMKLVNGCTDSSFDFSNSVYVLNSGASFHSTNTNAPSDGRCSMYKPNGGNMTPVIGMKGAIDVAASEAAGSTAVKAGHGGFNTLQVKGVGTDDVAGSATASELAFNMSFVSKDVCLAINDIAGVNNPGGDAPVGTITGSQGGYTNGAFTSTAILDDPDINGHVVFCRKLTSSYKFYHVMLER